jgi:hypothetical protein
MVSLAPYLLGIEIKPFSVIVDAPILQRGGGIDLRPQPRD